MRKFVSLLVVLICLLPSKGEARRRHRRGAVFPHIEAARLVADCRLLAGSHRERCDYRELLNEDERNNLIGSLYGFWAWYNGKSYGYVRKISVELRRHAMRRGSSSGSDGYEWEARLTFTLRNRRVIFQASRRPTLDAALVAAAGL